MSSLGLLVTVQTFLFAAGKVLLMAVKGNHPTPEPHEMVDKELRRLHKSTPKTTAEQCFQQWLLEWKENNRKVVENEHAHLS